MHSFERHHFRNHILHVPRGSHASNVFYKSYDVKRRCTIEVVVEQAPQLQPRLVSVQTIWVGELGRLGEHLGFALQERTDDHVESRINLGSILNALIDEDLAQVWVPHLIRHAPDAFEVLHG